MPAPRRELVAKMAAIIRVTNDPATPKRLRTYCLSLTGNCSSYTAYRNGPCGRCHTTFPLTGRRDPSTSSDPSIGVLQRARISVFGCLGIVAFGPVHSPLAATRAKWCVCRVRLSSVGGFKFRCGQGRPNRSMKLWARIWSSFARSETKTADPSCCPRTLL